ncbi:MAG: M48 family metallopeptidase [Prevotella sp.]|nr:M48 family metallopeptidase [Prevotella sp.]MBR1449045.1 M48 family metallopeptidase [Prevotella sp.]
MRYVGIQTQIRRNNTLSMLLLLGFPTILLVMVWVFLFVIHSIEGSYYDAYGNVSYGVSLDQVTHEFLLTLPWVVGGVGIWFAIAYFSNASMIRHATGARPISRRDNPRIYNIVENLTMACGMSMPQINVIDDPQLNAFASGIDEKSYTVTVTTGLMNRLNDDELAGVVGHELTHIRNRDTRLLITSIVFVGIISTVTSLIARILWNTFIYGGGGRRRSSNNGKNSGASIIVVLLIGLVCAAIAYFFTLLTRFAISRKREYMADAGGAELCGDPLALASALRKISANPGLGNVDREDIAQMYIIRPKSMANSLMERINALFSTHPSTERRIQLLEQF